MKTTITFLFFQIFLISSYGQSVKIENHEPEENYNYNHTFRIGITPSALFNEYPGLQINAAINLSKNLQLISEAGIIFYSLTSSESSINGYRLRPGLRYYLSNAGKYRFHFSLTYNIRKTTSTRIEEFYIVGEQRSEIAEFEHDKKISGFAPMIGVDIPIAKNFIVDLGLGLGVSKLEVYDREIPENGIRILEDYDGYDIPGIQDIPLTIFNAKIQYLF